MQDANLEEITCDEEGLRMLFMNIKCVVIKYVYEGKFWSLQLCWTSLDVKKYATINIIYGVREINMYIDKNVNKSSSPSVPSKFTQKSLMSFIKYFQTINVQDRGSVRWCHR